MAEIKEINPHLEVGISKIVTRGDRDRHTQLDRTASVGVFVKELEEALLDGRIDLAVHSLKDMPAELPDGLCLAARPPREDPRDALILREGRSLDDLPVAPTLGTSSLRRASQLLARWPEATIVPIRGNVQTRLAKLQNHDPPLDAIVLAMAGLVRLDLAAGLSGLVPLTVDDCLPAVGQGVLAVQCRDGDAEVLELLARLDDEDARACSDAERAFLAGVEGSCQVPVAAYATRRDGQVHIRARIASLDGREVVERERVATLESVTAEGRALADEMLAAGGRAILDTCVALA